MANTREIQSRMKSIQDTMKITNAMYTISSSKLKKARKMLTDTEPYFYSLQQMISRIPVSYTHLDVYKRQVYDSVLAPEGTVEFKTDNRGLFDYSLSLIHISSFGMVRMGIWVTEPGRPATIPALS